MAVLGSRTYLPNCTKQPDAEDDDDHDDGNIDRAFSYPVSVLSLSSGTAGRSKTPGTSGMAQRRSSHRSASLQDSAILSHRKLQARRATVARRRVFAFTNSYIESRPTSHASGSSPPLSPRPVLVPLHFNLRRLPSRILSERKDDMRDAVNGYDVSIGMKRKRVVSGSENTSGSRGARSTSRAKRRKPLPDSSDEEPVSEMDVDAEELWDGSDLSEDEEAMDSCTRASSLLSPAHCSSCVVADNYLINEAPPRRLLRLRKDELVELYAAAGLTEDAELLTKPEIVDCILAARDDVADLPPSSPGVADSGSSDYSSDGGNVAGGEETDFGHRFRNGMRRRATVHELGRATRRYPSDRSLSMSHLERSSAELSPSNGKRKRGLLDMAATQPVTGVSTRRSVRFVSCCVSPVPMCLPPQARIQQCKLKQVISHHLYGFFYAPLPTRHSPSHTQGLRRDGPAAEFVWD